MGVYVDQMLKQGWILYGRPVASCHLWADSVEELLEFATRICLPRAWLQGLGERGRVAHFDLTAVWRDNVIKSGAVELDGHATVESWQHWHKGGSAFQAGGRVYKGMHTAERPCKR